MSIATNIQNIERVLLRFPGSRLLAVTKTRSAEEIAEVLAAGVTLIGENRVQEMQEKKEGFPMGIEKHCIGHLQSNKVRAALELFDVLESVDSYELATKISAVSQELQRTTPIYLQVNISRELQKSGFPPEEILNMYQKIVQLPSIKISGLMCLGKLNAGLKETRNLFSEIKLLHTKCIQNFKLVRTEFELSMGMSQDYLIALEEGATIIRLGHVLFSS